MTMLLSCCCKQDAVPKKKFGDTCSRLSLMLIARHGVCGGAQS